MECSSLLHIRRKCQYHIVFIPKHRRKVMFGNLIAAVREILKNV